MNVALNTGFLGKADCVACPSVDAEAEAGNGEDARAPLFEALFAEEAAVNPRTPVARIVSDGAGTTPAIVRSRSPAAPVPFVGVEPVIGRDAPTEDDPLVFRPTSVSSKEEAVDRRVGSDGGAAPRQETASPTVFTATRPVIGRDAAGHEPETGAGFAPPGVYKDVLRHDEHGTGAGERAVDAERTTERFFEPRPRREGREPIGDAAPGEGDGGSGGVAGRADAAAPPKVIDITGLRDPGTIGERHGAAGPVGHEEDVRRPSADGTPGPPVRESAAGPDNAAPTLRVPADRAGAEADVPVPAPIAKTAVVKASVAKAVVEEVRHRPAPPREEAGGEDVVVAHAARRPRDGGTCPVTIDDPVDRRPVRREPSEREAPDARRSASGDATPRGDDGAVSATAVTELAVDARAVPAASPSVFHGEALPAGVPDAVAASSGAVGNARRAAPASETTGVPEPARASAVGEAVARAAGRLAGEEGSAVAVPAPRAPDAGRSSVPTRTARAGAGAATTLDVATRGDGVASRDEPTAPALADPTAALDGAEIVGEPTVSRPQAPSSVAKTVAEAPFAGVGASAPAVVDPPPSSVGTTPEAFSPTEHPAPEQVALKLTKAVHGGTTAVRMRLDPPELGAVEIRLEFHKDHLVAVISAERQDTLDLLRRDAPVLERALREAGGSGTGADLRFVHADGGGQSQAEGRGQTSAFLRVPRSLAEDAGAELLPPAAFHQPVWLPGSSLDVRA